jgi:hypothetical protein
LEQVTWNEGSKRFEDAFPLTLTLSLREREQPVDILDRLERLLPAAALRKPSCTAGETSGKWLFLSPGERSG